MTTAALFLTIFTFFADGPAVTSSAISDSGATLSTVTESDVRPAIERAVPYLEDRGRWWIEEKKCVTCHRVGNMVWSLAEARSKGFAVDDRLDEWQHWAIADSLKTSDSGTPAGAGNREGVAQLVLASSLFLDYDAASRSHHKLLAILRSDQQEDGSWKPGGQLPAQKRPKPETTAVSTAWIALALATDDDAESAEAVKQATAFLTPITTGQSTEWFVTMLLLADTTGDEALRDRARSQLQDLQSTDGGWGWLTGEESDALGTGMAVYALAKTQPANDSPETSIDRGLRFLLTTQDEDGSWPVHGTKANRKTKVQETSTYWGTTWAVLALATALDPATSSATAAAPSQPAK